MNGRNKKEIELAEGKLFSRKSSCAGICCSKGALWITFDKSGDIIIREGESVKAQSRTPVCVTALTDAAFTLTELSPHSKRETITAFLSFMRNGRESSRRSAVLE